MQRFMSAVLLILTAGCGSDQVPVYPVTGLVQFADGEPVRLGTIEFESLSAGTSATGTIQDDGSFVLGTYTADDGAAAGKHDVIVIQIIIDEGLPKHTKDHGRRVPTRFGDYSTSGLTATVETSDNNTLVITLPD